IGFTLLAFAAAAGVFGIWLMAAGRLNLPETLLGWVGLLGGSAAFVAAILCFFTALKAVDTISATLLANLEPLLAVTIAYLLLGEVLSTTQLFGGAVVLGSVILPTLAGRRECGNTLTKTK
ncbi:MAG: EamA family transporter, partial [Inquilinus sp.]|nr:EamA family transporter [Inquilinus sp.]